MERLLLLVALAAAAAVLAVVGRALARRRLARLRVEGSRPLWAALDAGPDGRPTVVAFSTPGCAACRSAQRPALAALEEWTGGGVRVIQVDAADRPEVAQAFGILTVPATVVLDAGGAVVGANQGFATAERLARQLGLAGC
jgi:thiol-disulfide isomerase/thioredoxin